MKVLGISGSPRKDETTSKLVREVLEGASERAEVEFISLAGKKISPCISCLACAKDNICKLNDDMKEIREKLVEADAVVVGGNNIYGTLNALTRAFFERHYQFHHNDRSPMKGKKAVGVAVAGGNSALVVRELEDLLKVTKYSVEGTVEAVGALPCFTCGLGHICKVSNVKGCIVDGKIDMDMKPALHKYPAKMTEARELGRRLVL